MDRGDARVTLPLASIKGSMGPYTCKTRGPGSSLGAYRRALPLKELLAGVFYFILNGGKTSTLYTTSIQ
jgi:hypothetical protein